MAEEEIIEQEKDIIDQELERHQTLLEKEDAESGNEEPKESTSESDGEVGAGTIESKSDNGEEESTSEEKDLNSGDKDSLGDDSGSSSENEDEENKGISIDKINEYFGTEFESEDDIRGMLSKQKNIEGKLADLEKQNNELKKRFNPESLFANKEEMLRQEVLKKFPGKDSTVANNILKLDINKLSDLEILKLGKLWDNPSLNGEGSRAMALIYKKFDLPEDESPEEWDQVTKDIISDAAVSVRKKLEDVKNIEVPEYKDYDSLKKEEHKKREENYMNLKNKWEPIVDRITGDKKLTIYDTEKDENGKKKVLYTFDVKGDNSKFSEQLLHYLAKGGFDPTNREHIAKAMIEKDHANILTNLPEILKSYGNKIKTTIEDKYHNEYNNDAPLKTDEAPDASSIEEDIKAYSSELLKEEKVAHI